jgi:hypothetical protein
MYPAEILNLFPPFPKNNMVFTAMSFDPKFKPRWDDVILPAVSSINESEGSLSAHRVDLESKNDSLITEIVKNISECKLFIGDLTTIGYLPIDGKSNRPIRNANVLYEVGLAHACRLPEEVILIRSDDDQLDFDISGVRVHKYNPDNVEEAIQNVRELLRGALSSINDRKRLITEKIAKQIDGSMYLHLLKSSLRPIEHPKGMSMAEVVELTALNRLLSIGTIESNFIEVTQEMNRLPIPQLVKYKITPFGKVVLNWINEKNKIEL